MRRGRRIGAATLVTAATLLSACGGAAPETPEASATRNAVPLERLSEFLGTPLSPAGTLTLSFDEVRPAEEGALAEVGNEQGGTSTTRMWVEYDYPTVKRLVTSTEEGGDVLTTTSWTQGDKNQIVVDVALCERSNAPKPKLRLDDLVTDVAGPVAPGVQVQDGDVEATVNGGNLRERTVVQRLQSENLLLSTQKNFAARTGQPVPAPTALSTCRPA